MAKARTAAAEPSRPVLLACEEVPPIAGEGWRRYRRRVARMLEPVRRQAAGISGLALEPLLAANALHGRASEGAWGALRSGRLAAGMTLVEWGDELGGGQMDDVCREIGLGESLPPPRNLTGHGVAVAVLDSGIDSRHPCLAVAKAVSTCPEPPGVPGRHGTHCAGVIASRSPRRPGVAPGVRLLDVKVARADGSTTPGWLAKGIDAALDLNADVLSISFGLNRLPADFPAGHGWVCSDGACILCRAVDHAVACGTVVVAAAGNEHFRIQAAERTRGALPPGSELICPGGARGALTVGALEKEPCRHVYPTSSRGLGKPDLLAPGVDVTSTVPLPPDGPPPSPLDLFGTGTGTSVAAAVVAGAAALLVERRRAAGLAVSASGIRQELLQHTLPLADPVHGPESAGARMLDLSALRPLRGRVCPPPG